MMITCTPISQSTIVPWIEGFISRINLDVVGAFLHLESQDYKMMDFLFDKNIKS